MDRVYHKSCSVCKSTEIKSILTLKDHSHTGEKFPVFKCCECGFHFTQNIPDEKSIGPYYKNENYVSHSDTQKGFFFKIYHSVRNYMLTRKQNLIQSNTGLKSGKLLDIGTGTGYFANQMIKSGWKVEGIEQDEETRNFASAKFNFKVHDTDEFYKLPAESFDAISMWHVLEHVHDLKGYLNQIHSILKPNGILVVAVPNHDSFDQEHYKEYWAAWDIPIHLWHFNPSTLKRLMMNYKFRVEKYLPMPFDAAYVSMLSEQYRSGSKIPGLFKGIFFAIKGKINPKRCSSVIYIIKKN
tara:strand:- start:110 stop:1000 length:891 start_codon:yes stop_codon:yes gene_type:complete